MFPKVGDVVQLNHDFLKVWFKKNGYFGKEVWKEKFTVMGIGNGVLGDRLVIKIEYKNFKYCVPILSNGESDLSNYNKEYKNIQIFIPANHETKENDIYCSCGGPKKENWVFGEKFYICTVCKKEAI